jgi:hypothetical protein
MTPDGPAPLPDPLSDLLSLASREGALEGEALSAFLEALRERARLVVAERFERQEARLPALEAENAWRRDAMTTLEAGVRSLEAEVAWVRASLTGLEAEVSWRRESMASLEENVRALGRQAERAAGAHGALLAHHRELVERVAAELVSIASLSPLRARQARRRLRALAGLLGTDSR